jgi:hypothetical protein
VVTREAASFRQFRGEPGLFSDLPFPVIFAEFHSRQGKRGKKTAIRRNLQGISRLKKFAGPRGYQAAEVPPEFSGRCGRLFSQEI